MSEVRHIVQGRERLSVDPVVVAACGREVPNRPGVEVEPEDHICSACLVIVLRSFGEVATQFSRVANDPRNIVFDV